jgi:hypothetical protein
VFGFVLWFLLNNKNTKWIRHTKKKRKEKKIQQNPKEKMGQVEREELDCFQSFHVKV